MQGKPLKQLCDSRLMSRMPQRSPVQPPSGTCMLPEQDDTRGPAVRLGTTASDAHTQFSELGLS